jgi:MarR family/STAS-like domain of unknown function (DUF4325)
MCFNHFIETGAAMSKCMMFTVGRYGPFLATRGRARAILGDLENCIAADAATSTAVIDFSGVDAMTISFADEFLGRFYVELAAGLTRSAGVVITGLNEETAEAIAICLERRELFAASRDGDRWQLLGAQHFLTESYEHALRLGCFKASDLAESLGITSQNANNRLKRLVEAGAVRRERVVPAGRGGKEYQYALPCASS